MLTFLNRQYNHFLLGIFTHLNLPRCLVAALKPCQHVQLLSLSGTLETLPQQLFKFSTEMEKQLKEF